MGSTHMIAIYISPIMVPPSLSPRHAATTLAASICLEHLHHLLQLLTHKDPHVFPRFEDHQRYAIVVATTSLLLLFYGARPPTGASRQLNSNSPFRLVATSF